MGRHRCEHGDTERNASGECKICRRSRQRRYYAENFKTDSERQRHVYRAPGEGPVGMDCKVCGRHLVREHGVVEFCIDANPVDKRVLMTKGVVRL
jgi:hypothetical protein